MRTEKLILAASFLLTVTTNCFAQKHKSQLWLEGGFNIAQFTVPDYTYGALEPKNFNKPTTYSRNGTVKSYKLGASMQLSVNKHWFLQSGFNYSGKGGRVLLSDVSTIDTRIGSNSLYPVTVTQWFNTSLHYLELPVNICYQAKCFKKNDFFIGSGMYVAWGLDGKTEFDQDPGFYIPQTNSVKFKTNRPNVFPELRYNSVQPFDFGVNILAGITYDKLAFKINYSQGLSDISNIYRDDYNGNKNVQHKLGKNQVLSICVAYKIH